MKKHFFSIVISFFFITSLSANENKYIKDTLLKYNYGLIKMGLSGETQFFKEFVKKDVAMKLQVWFESWKFSNLTYVAKINDLRFSPIVYNENNATISTMENWTFAYVNLDTKDYALKPINILYQMNYTLQKYGNKWKIIAIKHLKEEVLTDEKKHKFDFKPKKNSLKGDTTFAKNVE